jgi:hypothetical protein
LRQALNAALKELGELIARDPWSILNESELQALLQFSLLKALPQRPLLSLGSGLLNRRATTSYSSRRVYRELKVSSGRASLEADLVILHDAPQLLQPKANGAPSRFRVPYAAIVETKIDATPAEILAGSAGRRLSPDVLSRDLAKWPIGEIADEVWSLVYTAHPEWYAGIKGVITVRRPQKTIREPLPNRDASFAAAHAFDQAVKELHLQHRAEPFWFLREKDFETELFIALRRAVGREGHGLNPVRTQWFSTHSQLLARRRRHDLVVLADQPGKLLLELELKTSHSDTHNWFRKSDVAAEYAAMQMLKRSGHLERAVFTLFRYGAERWMEDAKALSLLHPEVELSYWCTEPPR